MLWLEMVVLVRKTVAPTQDFQGTFLTPNKQVEPVIPIKPVPLILQAPRFSQ